MPTLNMSGLKLHYAVGSFTDPWIQPETILLLHGNCESGDASYAWMPERARRYRVVRPGMRGFGRSTPTPMPMPRDFPWTLDVVFEDYCRLTDHLGIDRFHLVGAKIGGTIARAFAARRASRNVTLMLISTPTPFRPGTQERIPARTEVFEKQGVEHWGAKAWRAGSATNSRKKARSGG